MFALVAGIRLVGTKVASNGKEEANIKQLPHSEGYYEKKEVVLKKQPSLRHISSPRTKHAMHSQP